MADGSILSLVVEPQKTGEGASDSEWVELLVNVVGLFGGGTGTTASSKMSPYVVVMRARGEQRPLACFPADSVADGEAMIERLRAEIRRAETIHAFLDKYAVAQTRRRALRKQTDG
jgi:hypothetical protein